MLFFMLYKHVKYEKFVAQTYDVTTYYSNIIQPIGLKGNWYFLRR